jgi:hypothetical protein
MNCAINWPSDLIFAVFAKPYAPSLNKGILTNPILKRQINFILNFILFDLAQTAGKQNFIDLLVWYAVFEEAHGAFIQFLFLLPAPHAVNMAGAVTAVTDLFLFTKL